MDGEQVIKKMLKNKDLWIELRQLNFKIYQLIGHGLKGHSGHPGNDRADYLANKGVIKDESIL